MRAVRYEGTDDRRRLRASVVTPAALRRLCDELDGAHWQPGDEAAALYVRIAAATGGEIRPLSETRNGDYHSLPDGQGILLLRVTKRAKRGLPRDRELRLPRALAAEIEPFHRPDHPDGRLFPLSFERFWTMFLKARKRAGLLEAVLDASGQPTPIRPHDFRRVYALRGREAGVAEETLGRAGLGHDDIGTTRTYIRAETAISAEEAEAIFAAALGA
jgi:integrase